MVVEDVVPEARPVLLGSRIIGIDLGTTNSAAAVVKGGKPFIIPSREGYSTIPSVVAVSEKGGLIVGHVARDRLLVNPRGTVHGAKRLIGRQFHSPVVRDLANRFSYEIVAGPRGEAAVRLGDKIFSLQKISSMVLAQVKQLAEQWLGEEVTRAVITVPAYYNDNQRQAVRAAGALAGLQVERIVNEPTAAALAFAHGRGVEQRVLVYDLGGGTFDTSVLELHGNVYEVIATGGDTFLGGVDFDKALLDDLLARFKAQHGVDFGGDRVAYQRIAEAAEKAKVTLSERLTTQVNLPFVTAVGSRAYALQATVTRAELEGLTRALVERTLRVTDDVLTSAGLKPADIGEVLLVGGQSRMPLVRGLIKEFFGKEPCKSVHADEAVALGAAILADSLMASEVDAPVLLDVLPMSIGIGQPGGRFHRIIERNTTLPCRRTHSIWTSAQQGRTLAIPVFQGDQAHAQENEYLGTLLVADLPHGLDGDVVFDVTFTLSTESILTVAAEERGTARSVSVTFSTQDTPEMVRRRLEGAPAAEAPPPQAPDQGGSVFPPLDRAGEAAAGLGPRGPVGDAVLPPRDHATGALPPLDSGPGAPDRSRTEGGLDASTLPSLWDEPTATIEPTQTGLSPLPRPEPRPRPVSWVSSRMATGTLGAARAAEPPPGPLARLASWFRSRGRPEAP
ncbi:MAG: Hsp70 family protein [Anaeromyxobacter sp.]|nr:Hsp70 family protein [Anaeromyxobacter sp.]